MQEFGKDTLEIIESDPDRLNTVPGIGRTRVERIKQSWQEQKEIKNIMLFLQGHDVSTSHATKIYKTYGNDSIQIVSENPYKLADDIWGIGFRTADTIAEKMGFGHERYVRLRSGILYTLNRLSDEGHCYATRDMLLRSGSELLNVEDNILSMTLDEMIRANDVIVETPPPSGRRQGVVYDISELDELVLAYATTIHKSQGSEYPIVVIPVLMNHYIMLQRNLIYTGITRAKKILVLVGTKKALDYAIRNVTVTKRNTMLKERLQKAGGR